MMTARAAVPSLAGLRGGAVGLLVVCLAAAPAVRAQGFDADSLRSRVEAYGASTAPTAAGQPLHATPALIAFYTARGHDPAWLSPGGAWGPGAETAMALLDAAPSHGLDPEDYHGEVLGRLRDRVRAARATSGERIDAEILLTDGVLRYGMHLLRGSADPARLEAEWTAARRDAAVDRLLAAALEGSGLAAFVEAVAPPHPEYGRLVDALSRLRAVAATGGWPRVGDGPSLHPDSSYSGIVAVRARLAASIDPAERVAARAGGRTNPTFDVDLAEAVRSFQRRHGLDDDGVVGRRTRAAMDVPVHERIAQIEINLERWRWLPENLGHRHIRVAVPDFTTEYWEAGRRLLSMRSIVGRPDRPTPSFAARLEHVVLAPWWHVPPTIAAIDKLPVIAADPGYVEASHMILSSAATGEVVDPYSVDWSTVTGAEFNRRFRLRQEPGPANALGDVKFVFPNPHSVYLHGTPQQGLFSRWLRTLSSGCIRVESPLRLAELLLSDVPGWTPARIREVVAEGVETSVNLSEPVQVYLLYFTAFVAPDGALHFRDDVYGRDVAVRGAQGKLAPSPLTRSYSAWSSPSTSWCRSSSD